MTFRESFDRMYRSISVMDVRSAESGRIPQLNYRDMLYLYIIALTEDCTVSKTAELLGVSLPAVTKRINSLEERGLVTKTKQEGDGRFKTVSLTPRGRDIMYADEGELADILDRVESSLTEDELRAACKVMDTIAEMVLGSRRGDGGDPPLKTN